jgi:hypothetical protein
MADQDNSCPEWDDTAVELLYHNQKPDLPTEVGLRAFQLMCSYTSEVSDILHYFI